MTKPSDRPLLLVPYSSKVLVSLQKKFEDTSDDWDSNIDEQDCDEDNQIPKMSTQSELSNVRFCFTGEEVNRFPIEEKEFIGSSNRSFAFIRILQGDDLVLLSPLKDVFFFIMGINLFF